MKKSSKQTPETQVSLNPDTTPILYTDEIHMTTNDFGLVMDVIQKLGATNQGRVVTRIGMSREHARAFTQELGKLLLLTEKKGSGKLN